MMAVIVAALVVRGWQLGWVARMGLAPLVLFQAVVGGDMIFTDSWPRLMHAARLIRSGHEGHRDDESRFTYRAALRQLGDHLPPDAELLLHSTVMNLGINHQVLHDCVGKQGLFDSDQVSDIRGLWEKYRAAGVTHVAHLPGIRGTFNRAHDVLFIDFLTNVALNRRRFGAYEVAEVPETPPPRQPDYRVVLLGVNYKDGLYRIEQMRVHENRLPVADRPPPPQIPWPSHESAQLNLIQRVRAVVVGARFGAPPVIAAILSRDFREAEIYRRKYSIWIRRRG
jgi:hypothetical protein